MRFPCIKNLWREIRCFAPALRKHGPSPMFAPGHPGLQVLRWGSRLGLKIQKIIFPKAVILLTAAALNTTFGYPPENKILPQLPGTHQKTNADTDTTKPDIPAPGEWYFGAGASLFHITETSPTQQYNVRYTAPGLQLEGLYRKAAGYGFAASLGFHSLSYLKVNDRNVDLSERSQWFYPLQTSAFLEITDSLSAGAGLDVLFFSSFYFQNQRVPNSAGRDIYLALMAQSHYPLTGSLELLAQFRMGLNLTPGHPEFVGLNNLLAFRWALNLSLLYRLRGCC